ncbi:hypothetical protein GUJ93_ZPchr0012g19367 [Zizania palustris]|uniref:Uncharacterized protein n=1 Tax=Zizania palustris TaxID=103762 RepID=A0A8J5WQJ2_ZIZPA|nr:hypothetical protein GUJ93_ZPchr0012g19367 [Zizania palustris]
MGATCGGWGGREGARAPSAVRAQRAASEPVAARSGPLMASRGRAHWFPVGAPCAARDCDSAVRGRPPRPHPRSHPDQRSAARHVTCVGQSPARQPDRACTARARAGAAAGTTSVFLPSLAAGCSTAQWLMAATFKVHFTTRRVSIRVE